MKTFGEICLERAQKATEGPWHTGHMNEEWTDQGDIDGPNHQKIAEEVVDWDRHFIIRARTDIPELAQRLKRACEHLRHIGFVLNRDGNFPNTVLELEMLADELERPME